MFLVAVVLMIVALVRIVHVTRLVAVMLVNVTLVNVVVGLGSHIALSSWAGCYSSFNHIRTGLAKQIASQAVGRKEWKLNDFEASFATGSVRRLIDIEGSPRHRANSTRYSALRAHYQ